MKKIILSLIGLVLVFGFGLMGIVGAAGTTLYVDDDDATCGGNSPCYSTIQAAINAANTGDTINVAAGTYVEAVIIDKSLTLLGAKADVDPLGGAWTGGVTIINPGAGNTGIDIQASDVVVNGFEVTGGMYGIYIGSANVGNVEIKYNELHDNSKYGCQPIGLGVTVSDITISKNYFHDNGRNGLKMVDVTDCLVDSNEFAYNGFGIAATKPEYKYGIFLEDQRYNSSHYSPAIRNTFANNIFHDNNLGAINMEAMGTAASSHWTSTEFFEDTVVHNNNFYGDSSVWGINVNNDYEDDGSQDGFGPISTVDAEYNWWGASDGPSHSPGSGNKVSDYVDYDPWLCEEAPSDWHSVDGVCADTTAPIITFVEPASGTTHNGVINLRATCNEDCDYVNFWWRAESEPFAWYRYHYVHEDGTVFEWGLNTLNAQLADGNSYLMEDGTYYLYAAGKDLAGNWAKTSEIQVTVDNTAPVVTINSPTDGILVSGTVDIFGSIIEKTELSHYNISIYPGDADFMDFSQRLEQKTVYQSSGFDNELIYQWDTTTYDDGEYLIRLAARDKARNRDLSGDPYLGGDDSQHVIRVFIGNTKAGILEYSGVPGKGLENAPGLQKPFNPKSQAAKHAGKK